MTVTYIKQGVIGPVFIDTISVVLDVPDKQQWEVESNLKSLLTHYGYMVSRPMYQFSARLFLQYPDVHVEVSIQPKFQGVAYMRVELNPAQGYLGEFCMLMEQLLPGGYMQLIAHGQCTRIDAAVDVMGVNVNHLLITFPKMRKTKGFYNSGRLETYVLGVKQGHTEICVYDKRSQIQYLNNKHHLNIKVPHQNITRIEVRKRKGSYKLINLPNLPNIFDGLLIASYPTLVGSPATLKQKEDKEKFELFVEVCRSRGAQDALKMISEPTREKYRKRLEDCKLPWWNPTEIWKGWKVPANALLHPTHLGE